MAFEKLQGLGEDKFRKIINGLVRGRPAMVLAREIQQEWGDCKGMAEKTLTQQLLRLRKAAAEGMFGKTLAKQITEGMVPKIEALDGVNISSIDRMEELASVQRSRIFRLVANEKTIPVMAGPIVQATNSALSDYSKLLQDIQKIRFDLGLDEFKGVITGMRGASMSATLPDGTHIQKQVFEAVNVLEEIFMRRNVPKPIDVPRF